MRRLLVCVLAFQIPAIVLVASAQAEKVAKQAKEVTEDDDPIFGNRFHYGWSAKYIYSQREESRNYSPQYKEGQPETYSNGYPGQIRDIILLGHQAYYRGRYQVAINLYREARSKAYDQLRGTFFDNTGDIRLLTPKLFEGIRTRVQAFPPANVKREEVGGKPIGWKPVFHWHWLALTPWSLDVDFDDKEFSSKILANVYEKRLKSNLTPELQTYPDNNNVVFAVMLPHYYLYIIPLCLGDSYHQLGNYKEAIAYYRDAALYKYLNPTIEVPELWLRIARSYMAWGDALYRKGDRQSAKALYEKILLKGEPTGSEVYEGPFAQMKQQVLKVIRQVPISNGIASSEKKKNDDAGCHPGLIALVREIASRGAQVNAELNYLGYSDDYVPQLRFTYLQNIARSFAQYASQANREYITFKRSAEEETYSIRQLEQLVELNRISYGLELQRVEVAKAETLSAEAVKTSARTRLELAGQERKLYETVGSNILSLDEALAWANASTQQEMRLRFPPSGLEQLGNDIAGLGIPASDYNRRDLIRRLTAKRSRLTYGLELARLDRNLIQYKGDETIAENSLKAASARQSAADLGADAAKWRWQASSENLDFLRNKEMNADLYTALASGVRETALIYLQRAIEVAFLMERAYEFENGVKVRRVRFDYGDLGSANGLLAADLLIRDIDSFTREKITEGQAKPQPAACTISLANQHPLEFVRLRQTGKMDFSTMLEDFHRDQPGLYQARIKKVELVFEGLVGSSGPIGSLSCGGFSRFRDRDGNIKEKLHPTETLLLSDYKPRRDVLIAETPPEVLNVFENTGIDNHWVLSLPKHLNDFDYANLTDVRMVVTYLGQHDVRLERKDIEDAPKIQDAVIWYSLKRDVGQDAFFLLAKEGRLDFSIERGMIPYNHGNPKIKGITMVALKREGSATIPIKLRLWSDQFGKDTGSYVPEKDGSVIIQANNNRVGFYGLTPITGWHLAIDPAENPDLKPIAGTSKLDLRQVSDILFVMHYEWAR